MTITDVITLLPFIVMAATAVVVMMVIAFHRHHRLTVLLTLAGLVLAFVSLPLVASNLPRQITPLMIVDGYAFYYIGLLLATTFVIVVLSYGYLEGDRGNREEYYVLLLLATLGSAVLVASDHFASFFLGLEILSISLYALIAYPRFQQHSIEAAIKYLILASATSAFLLFGMALIYAELGTLSFSQMVPSEAFGDQLSLFLLAGLGLLSVGIGFKLALVPFHLWTPDVYQGAPAPVTAFVATVSKGGVLALLLRYFTLINAPEYSALTGAFTVIAIASMLFGNLLALMQNRVKRILAYSSIAHLGYLLIPVLASGSLAQSAVAFYLVAYFVTTLVAFGVVTVLSSYEKEADELEEYRSLFWRRPWLATIFAAALLSLAGIPPMVGLVGKIFIAAAGIGSNLWLLVVVLILASVISVFYYVRVIVTMYRRPEEEEVELAAVPSYSAAGGVVLAVLTLLMVGLGVYPTSVIQLIETTVISLR